MRRFSLITVLAMVLAFELAPTASAGQDPFPAVVTAQASAAALQHWGGSLRCGQPQLFWDTTDEFVAASNGYYGRPDSTVPAIAFAVLGKCQVHIRAEWMANEDVLSYCGVLTHEFGHLSGLMFDNPADPEHSTDPNSIMYSDPQSTGVEYRVPECVQAFNPLVRGCAKHKVRRRVRGHWRRVTVQRCRQVRLMDLPGSGLRRA